jgi:hypothetical protein
MIQNFYITSADILDPEDKSFSLYDPELTAQLMDGNNTFKDLLQAIEDFNGNKPRNKRLMYSVYVNGFNQPIFVAKAKFIGDDFIYLYAYNNNGALYVTQNNNKPNFIDGVSTYLVKFDQITSINFGSFNKEDCPFLNKTKTDTISEDKMLTLLTDEIASLNSAISSGEYRMAINHFCMFMKNNKINEYDFNYNSAAFNKYIILCGTYMSLIKDIVGRHDDSTINVNDPKVPNKMYFFTNKAAMEEFVKIAEHSRMNITINNTFYDEDIEIFKSIIKPE